MLTAKDYKDAIIVQDAVNLSGVVRSFNEVLSKIWEEAREVKGGTEYVNNHAISVLYSSKISSLTRSEDLDFFAIAYEICQEKSEE